MKRHYVEYEANWRPAPLSYWVHVEADGQPWYEASVFEPPLPRPVPGKGYPYFYVEYDNFTFEFASLDEIDACIAVLSQKNLPSIKHEILERRTGPGSHWLSKLPGRTKSWHYRQQAVKWLAESRKFFVQEIGA